MDDLIERLGLDYVAVDIGEGIVWRIRRRDWERIKARHRRFALRARAKL